MFLVKLAEKPVGWHHEPHSQLKWPKTPISGLRMDFDDMVAVQVSTSMNVGLNQNSGNSKLKFPD